MTPPILQTGDPRLRRTAREVPREDILGTSIQRTLATMRLALAGEPHGVAIAAPQIGVPLRIFVVSGAVFAASDKEERPADRMFINPTLVSRSKKTSLLEEGCLSVRGILGKIERAERATVRAFNERGEEFTLEGDGLLAQIFQHELDHLDGMLFTDNAQETWVAPPDIR